MKTPSLSELPQPFKNNSKWPRGIESPESQKIDLKSTTLPKISIITPSYNQGKFIEETIRSVLLQDYPDIEYIIIDGGSSDETIDIIKKYEPWISFWISECDNGQSDAINKGWMMAKGDIIAYLNSDDIFAPDCLNKISNYFIDHPEVDLIYGDAEIIDENSEFIHYFKSLPFDIKKLIFRDMSIPQPTMFFRRKLFEKIGYLDVSLHYTMDFDFWLRTALKFNIQYIPKNLASMRYHINTKTHTHSEKFSLDEINVLDKLFSTPNLSDDIKKIKNAAYAKVYLRIALNCCKINDLSRAKENCFKAFNHHPISFLNFNSIGIFLSSFLGNRCYIKLTRIRERIIHTDV